MKRVLLAAAILLCALQAAAPLATIVRYERTLRDGHAYKIRVAPVDPADAFRGRYIAIQPQLVADAEGLGFPPGTVLTDKNLAGRNVWDEPGWAVLGLDPDGFARVTRFSGEPPDTGDALKVRAAGFEFERLPQPSPPDTRPRILGVRLDSSLDVYYTNERLAPKAEQAWRDASRGPVVDAWIVVRVRGDAAAIEALYVGGRRIEDAAR